jgi:hypothetical protein
MADGNVNLPKSLQVQENRLLEIRRSHVARLQESGILQKAQRAYMAEYMPIPSGGGVAGLDISRSLSADQFSVSHDLNGSAEQIMIFQGGHFPILVGAVTSLGGTEFKVEANQKRGFNAVDVKSVASMAKELVSSRRFGELPDLSDDLQRIERLPIEQPSDPQQSTVTNNFVKETPSPETKVDLEKAVRLLSYSDVLPKQYQNDAIDAIKKGEATMEYAEELVNLYQKYGPKTVEKLARDMVQFCVDVLKKNNITPTIYAPSVSWALWDIAKQSYLAKHPDKSLPEYVDSLEDPFALSAKGDKKRSEIRERHIGWEVMRRWDQGEVRAASLAPAAQQILTSGKRNETGQLRSYELAQLGHIISNRESI